MVRTPCEWCGKEVIRAGVKPGRFCSLLCKGEWQRTQKPVDRDWLYQKYAVEGLTSYAIGKLVNRDAKRVSAWLQDFGIQAREPKWSTARVDLDQPCHQYQDKRWLTEEYQIKHRSAREIALEVGVSENLVLLWLDKQDIPRRTVAEVRKVKHWGLSGAMNGMYGRRGERNPHWKGGATPERQSFYTSEEWKLALKMVWQRDKGHCQRCGTTSRGGSDKFHIHHIISFAHKGLRADPKNLVLLCGDCHRWVHSNLNTKRVFRKQLKVQATLF